jgi:hypothetical protein
VYVYVVDDPSTTVVVPGGEIEHPGPDDEATISWLGGVQSQEIEIVWSA